MNIKSILTDKIRVADGQINQSNDKIATEELYRNKWVIRKAVFEELLEEISGNTGEEPKPITSTYGSPTAPGISDQLSLENNSPTKNKELIPFMEIPAFEVSKSRIPTKLGKYNVTLVDNKLVIYNTQYKINIFTTLDEIKRLKLLPEFELKLTLQDYGKRTYPNKEIVLRHFLRELVDINKITVEFKADPPKFIPTYSTMKQVDEIKK